MAGYQKYIEEAYAEERKKQQQSAQASLRDYYSTLNQMPIQARAAAMGVPAPSQGGYMDDVIASMPKKTEAQLAEERAKIMSLGESQVSQYKPLMAEPQQSSATQYTDQLRGQIETSLPAATQKVVRSSTTPPSNMEFNPFTRKFAASSADAQAEKAAGYNAELERLRAGTYAATHGGKSKEQVLADRAAAKERFGMSKSDRGKYAIGKLEAETARTVAEANTKIAERKQATEESIAKTNADVAKSGMEVDKQKIDYLSKQGTAEEVKAAQEVELTKLKKEIAQIAERREGAQWRQEYQDRSDKLVNNFAMYNNLQQSATVREWVGQSDARKRAWASQLQQSKEFAKSESPVISLAVDKGFDSYSKYAKANGIDVPFTKQQFDSSTPETKRMLKKSLLSSIITKGALQALQSNVAQYDAADLAERGSVGDFGEEFFPKPK